MMKTVQQILQTKGTNIWSISPDAPIYDGLKLMADKNAGALLVLEAGQLVGIISERDYARKVVLQGKSATDTPIKEIMTSRVVCVYPKQTVEECMQLMTDNRVRHLPVLVEGGQQVIGVVSIGDIVKAIISQQEFMIEQLQSYIVGG